MTIRDILLSALRRVGRDDIVDALESGGEPIGSSAEAVDTMMYCINAVEDELARYYFPLKCTETLRSTDNKTFYFSDFANTPVKILQVKSGGKEVKFELRTNCLIAGSAEIEITYFYAPKKKRQEDNSEFGDMGDGYITALGAAAEYCLINGEISMSEALETRYREDIDRARRKADIYSEAYIPPRRWI